MSDFNWSGPVPAAKELLEKAVAEQQAKPVTMPEGLKNWKMYCPDAYSPEVWEMNLAASPVSRNVVDNAETIRSIVDYLIGLEKENASLKIRIEALENSQISKPNWGDDE